MRTRYNNVAVDTILIRSCRIIYSGKSHSSADGGYCIAGRWLHNRTNYFRRNYKYLSLYKTIK